MVSAIPLKTLFADLAYIYHKTSLRFTHLSQMIPAKFFYIFKIHKILVFFLKLFKNIFCILNTRDTIFLEMWAPHICHINKLMVFLKNNLKFIKFKNEKIKGLGFINGSQS